MKQRPSFPARLDTTLAKNRPNAHGVPPPPLATTPVQPPAGAKPVAATQKATAAPKPAAPQGHGMESSAVRARMVQKLAAGGITDAHVLAAMGTIERHRFVDSALINQAYEDTSLPIGLGQTISKPGVVSRMLELLRNGNKGKLGRVLEIGTGCGYQAAVLAQLSTQVISVERLKALHELAARHLHRLQVPRCRLVYGDGMRGHPPNAPYDTIIAAAGGDELPSAWLDQLAVGGRLVAPARSADGRGQVLVIVDRTPDGLHRRLGEAVQFVPLKSGTH